MDLVATLGKVMELVARRQELVVRTSTDYALAELRTFEEVAKAGRKSGGGG